MKAGTALNRSQNMALIKSRDTSPEVFLRKALWRSGLRYRIHYKTPVGRPDIVFPGRKIALFLDGCFWHGCPVHYVRPRSRSDFWAAKLLENVRRDARQTQELEAAGWRVLRVWEHAVFTSLKDTIECIMLLLDQQVSDPRDDFRVFRVEPIDDDLNLERRFLWSLRDEDSQKVIEGSRYTTKWKVPK